MTTTLLQRVAMVGNHLPRQCGIATFTTDLRDALAREFPLVDCFVVAMNESGSKHVYPPQVRFEIAQGDVTSYRRAADFLNGSPVDVVSLQHEFGIFGGKAGSHVLALLAELRIPVVTTLHTILAEPNDAQRAVMNEVTGLSDRLVVMSVQGAELLERVYGVAPGKIDRIPHGIPVAPSQSLRKGPLGVQGKRVVLTFGLLSPDKGIEYVIEAMPGVLERYPETLYIVVGATHPQVKKESGEMYRLSLEHRAQRLGVAGSVVFHNRFVSHAELAEFLLAADVYVTPYLTVEQSTSGTLAYAVGSGKAVISTPYGYARELLADGRGILVPARDASAIQRAIETLFSDPPLAQAMSQRALAYSKDMAWPVVARAYVAAFDRARSDHAARSRDGVPSSPLSPRRRSELPEMKLEHLRLLTDDTGLLQHATYDVPRYDTGYCIDDNARALLLVTLLEDAGLEDAVLLRSLGARYTAFVQHAWNAREGRFRNFMTYDRRWAEERGSEDSHGRALWALGTVVGRSGDAGRRTLARSLFDVALPASLDFTSPRAWAYALLGMEEYLRLFGRDAAVIAALGELSSRLLACYRASHRDGWLWFENSLTYCNARLSQALIESGARLGNTEMSRVGVRSLEWLASVQQTPSGYFAPVGSNGFYTRGGDKVDFDQQPVEACAMVSACFDAERVTSSRLWGEYARRAFGWFVGQNQLLEAVYDPRSGGCRDGLHADRVNENQGAESTVSFLLALLEMRVADRAVMASSGEREGRS